MRKESLLAKKRLLKKKNSNKENPFLCKEIIGTPFYRFRPIRDQLNKEYGIKVTNKDIKNRINDDINGNEKILECLRENNQLTDEEFEQKVKGENRTVSGNVNEFVLQRAINQIRKDDNIPDDTYFKRDKTRFNLNKLKTKQLKYNRDIKLCY